MTPNQIYGMVRRNGELNLPPNIAEVALSVPHLHVDSKKLIEYANAASVPTVTFELSGPTVICAGMAGRARSFRDHAFAWS